MSGCVTVTGPPASICCLNFGITEPFDASTLPNRTAISRIAGRRCARRAKSASSAWQYISAKRLVAPSTDTGSIALSVEIITIAATPAAAAASATFTEPNTLVFTPSPQSRSSSGTCLSAAAWNTMSGLNSANTPKMRSRSRTSAMRLSIAAPVPFCFSASTTVCSATSECSTTINRAAPNAITRSQISAPIEPPPPVTITDLPRMNCSSRW